jgi:hypothetical protein
MSMISPVVVREAIPFGEVTLAPFNLTGKTESELAHSLAEHVAASGPESDAEALALMRREFPRVSLATRVAALGALIRAR